ARNTHIRHRTQTESSPRTALPRVRAWTSVRFGAWQASGYCIVTLSCEFFRETSPLRRLDASAAKEKVGTAEPRSNSVWQMQRNQPPSIHARDARPSLHPHVPNALLRLMAQPRSAQVARSHLVTTWRHFSSPAFHFSRRNSLRTRDRAPS